MIRNKLTIVSALVAVFLIGGLQAESFGGTVYNGDQVSSARMAKIARIRARRQERRRARRIALVLAARAQQQQTPFTELSDVSDSNPGDSVTQVPGEVSGGTGSVGTGGGEVPEPAVWMGLAGCAAVMVGANRFRRKR